MQTSESSRAMRTTAMESVYFALMLTFVVTKCQSQLLHLPGYHYNPQKMRFVCYREPMPTWNSQRVKLYHPPCYSRCMLLGMKDWTGISTKSYVLGGVDLTAKHLALFWANERIIPRQTWVDILSNAYRPRLMLAAPVRTMVFRGRQLLARLQSSDFIQPCSYWSNRKFEFPLRIAIYRNTYYLGMFSDILSEHQMSRIARGRPETIVIPPGTKESVTLVMMYSLFTDCVPIIAGEVMEKRYYVPKLRKLGINSIQKVEHVCNSRERVEMYSMTITVDPQFSGEYGVHCRQINDTEQFLFIGDPVRTIKVNLVMGEQEPSPSHPGPPVIELLIKNGSHLIVPPQNTSAFFDVRIKPAPDEITFYRTDGKQSTEDIVQTELREGLFRIAFYRLKSTHSGVYQLNATLGSHTAVQLVTVTISEKIVLHVSQLRRAVAEGVSAELVCTATGWPLPQVNWTMGLGPVPQTERIKISTQQTTERTIVSTISFTSPELKDSGYYVCDASNPADHESRKVVFDVYPFGSHFVDKGFGDITVDTEEEEEGMPLCEGGTCDDTVFFAVEAGEEVDATVSPSGAIVVTVAVGGGLLIAAMVVAVLILLTIRCAQKHKKKGNKKKEEVKQHESSLQLRRRLAGKKTREAGSESKPLLHSHSLSERKDSGSFSEHVDSDTSLDY